MHILYNILLESGLFPNDIINIDINDNIYIPFMIDTI